MSKLVTSPVWRGGALRSSVLGMAVATALALPQVAAAMEFDLGSDNLSFRWDNTVRLNIQDRVAGQNRDMMANPNFDDGDRNFSAGSKWTRFDLYSEADLVWKPSWGTLGARVSGAGWWDPGYDSLDNSSVQTANNLDSNGNPTLKLPNYTNRYAKGASAEWMDWFLFSSFNIGKAPVNVKVGQTTVYWGESLLFNGAVHGISYGQNPVDVWKGLATPGAEVKELFRPRVGLNINSQVTDTLNVAAQYFFNWQNFSNQAYRYPESGSFLSVGDYVVWGGKSIVAGLNPLYGYPQPPPSPSYPLCALAPYPEGGATCAPQQYSRLWRTKDITPDENSGNYGLAVRWAPEWADATIGLYYRRTYDMQPQAMVTPDVIPMGAAGTQANCYALLGGLALGGGQCLQNSVAAVSPGPTPPYPPVGTPIALTETGTDFINKGRVGTYNLAYGSGIDMLGLSLSKSLGSLSLGAELSYRKDMPLLSDPVTVLPAALQAIPGFKLPAGAIYSDHLPKNDTPGAKGDTIHGLVNLVGIMGESLWDTASWTTELTWMTYTSVTQNEAVFKGRSNHIVMMDTPNGPAVDPSRSWTAYNLIDHVDKNYFGLAFNFTPTWFQVQPGMDVLAPISWSQGISGNSAITGGGQDGAGTFGIGIALDFYQRYRFDLKYVGFYGNYEKCGSVPGGTTAASVTGTCRGASPSDVAVFNGTNAIVSDRDFIALTFKTTF